MTSVTPNDHDILLGRSSMAKRHPGNSIYRELVEKNQPLYSSHRKRNAKAKITNEIINTVKDIGGRFLVQSRDGGWEEITDKKVFEKVSQALRENQPELRKQLMYTNKGKLSPGTVSLGGFGLKDKNQTSNPGPIPAPPLSNSEVSNTGVSPVQSGSAVAAQQAAGTHAASVSTQSLLQNLPQQYPNAFLNHPLGLMNNSFAAEDFQRRRSLQSLLSADHTLASHPSLFHDQLMQSSSTLQSIDSLAPSLAAAKPEQQYPMESIISMLSLSQRNQPRILEQDQPRLLEPYQSYRDTPTVVSANESTNSNLFTAAKSSDSLAGASTYSGQKRRSSLPAFGDNDSQKIRRRDSAAHTLPANINQEEIQQAESSLASLATAAAAMLNVKDKEEQGLDRLPSEAFPSLKFENNDINNSTANFESHQEMKLESIPAYISYDQKNQVGDARRTSSILFDESGLQAAAAAASASRRSSFNSEFSSIAPGRRRSSVQFDGDFSSILTPGRRSSVQFDDMSSMMGPTRRTSVQFDDVSLSAPSRRDSVIDDVSSILAPASRRGSVQFDDLSTMLPPSRRGSVQFDDLSTMLPPSRRSSVQFDDLSVMAPNSRRGSVQFDEDFSHASGVPDLPATLPDMTQGMGRRRNSAINQTGHYSQKPSLRPGLVSDPNKVAFNAPSSRRTSFTLDQVSEQLVSQGQGLPPRRSSLIKDKEKGFTKGYKRLSIFSRQSDSCRQLSQDDGEELLNGPECKRALSRNSIVSNSGYSGLSADEAEAIASLASASHVHEGKCISIDEKRRRESMLSLLSYDGNKLRRSSLLRLAKEEEIETEEV